MTDGLTENERVGHYVTMWNRAVEVNQHFNDIEWRIRGLALTVATFALGAAGVAARDSAQVLHISLGTLVLVVGLLLWYAFYFVDRWWYHPLLKASVRHAESIENAIIPSLPQAGLSQAITAGSPYRPTGLVKRLSGTEADMHSDDKLLWFYRVGAAAMFLVAVVLQVGLFFADDEAGEQNEQIVKIDVDHHGRR